MPLRSLEKRRIERIFKKKLRNLIGKSGGGHEIERIESLPGSFWLI